jgi:hypothetical protein
MKKALMVTIFVSMLGLCLCAQARNHHEVQGGLTVQADSGDAMIGFGIGYTYFFSANFGVTTDFRGQYRDNRDFYQWLAGPRFTFNRGGWVSPFVQGLVGVSHYNVDWCCGNFSWDSTQFVAGGGLGLDVKISRNASIRVLQLDFLRQMGDLDNTHVQVLIGLSFRF